MAASPPFFLTLMCNFSDLYNGRELRWQSCPWVPGLANLEASHQGASPRAGGRSLVALVEGQQEEEKPSLSDYNILGADRQTRCRILVLRVQPLSVSLWGHSDLTQKDSVN